MKENLPYSLSCMSHVNKQKKENRFSNNPILPHSKNSAPILPIPIQTMF